MLHQIMAQQFYTNSSLSTVLSPTEIVEFKDFSRLLSDFPVLFKADLIFKDFSRKPSKFKYFSSLYEPRDIYGRCSKISNTSSLPKNPRQTVQTQIRLLPHFVDSFL